MVYYFVACYHGCLLLFCLFFVFHLEWIMLLFSSACFDSIDQDNWTAPKKRFQTTPLCPACLSDNCMLQAMYANTKGERWEQMPVHVKDTNGFIRS